jgi:hypothetical protein
LIFVVALMGIVAATAVAQVTKGIDGARARAAARYLAQQCALARVKAVVGTRAVAIRFTPRGDDYEMQMFVDGNRNGVLTTDIARGVDAKAGEPARLGNEFPGVRIGILPDLGGAPVRLSGSTLLSFSPMGTATSGSIFVLGRDRAQFAVRVLGATARTRLQRYIPERDEWVDL